MPRLLTVASGMPTISGDLFHRFLMVVDEVDDLAMLGRQSGQALPQHRAFIFLRQRHFRIVGVIFNGRGRLIIQFLLAAPPQRRQRLEAGDAQHPGRDRRASLELFGLPPDVEKHFADQVLRRCFVAHHPQHEPVDADMMTREQDLHGEPIAAGDASDQNLVRSRLHRQAIGSCIKSPAAACRFKRSREKFARLVRPLILASVVLRASIGKSGDKSSGLGAPSWSAMGDLCAQSRDSTPDSKEYAQNTVSRSARPALPRRRLSAASFPGVSAIFAPA